MQTSYQRHSSYHDCHFQSLEIAIHCNLSIQQSQLRLVSLPDVWIEPLLNFLGYAHCINSISINLQQQHLHWLNSNLYGIAKSQSYTNISSWVCIYLYYIDAIVRKQRLVISSVFSSGDSCEHPGPNPHLLIDMWNDSECERGFLALLHSYWFCLVRVNHLYIVLTYFL